MIHEITQDITSFALLEAVRAQTMTVYEFSRFGGELDVALLFPLPVSRATGDGYPLPFNSAMSITISFWFLATAVFFLSEFDLRSEPDRGDGLDTGLSFASPPGRSDIWARASRACVRSASDKSSSRAPFASSTARRLSSVFVS